MSGRQVRLTELVDFNRLQQLQDNFAASTGFTSIILDQNGAAITRISNANAFSQLVERAEHADDGCLCFTSLGGIRAKNDDPLVFTCPYSGFTTVYVPILHEGAHIASWGILQVRVDDPSDAMLRKTAASLRLAEETVRNAVQQTPVYTEKELYFGIQQLQSLVQGLLAEDNAMPAPVPVSLNGPQAQKAERTMQLMGKFMGSADTGMLVCDYETGEIITANPFYEGWVGESHESIVGKRPDQLPGHDFDCGLAACTRETMLNEKGVPAEPHQWNDYGAQHGAWLRCSVQLVYWADGRLAHMVTFRDTSNERRMQDELSRLAYYDRQMNLPNSLKLAADLDMIHAKGTAAGVYLVCLDIQNLRKLNDAHGRKTGDAFLHTVAKWISHQKFSRESELYRIEGDEFCLLLGGSSCEGAFMAAQRIYDRFGDLWSLIINGQQISILCGVSLSVIGVGSLGDEEELLNIMQRTLDMSHREHKVIVYNEETDSELRSHIEIQLSLKKCIKQNMRGFEVYYQPIVDPATGTWKALEALCRWNSPEAGAISPMVFIREAEQLGLINDIGEWVLETAIRDCKRWGTDQLADFFISVNLSPVQIMSTSLINTTLDILRRHNYPGEKLSLEVTESTKLNFDNHTLGVIEKLRGHGIMIALDDFGTGYSSFNNMKNLPVRFLKTDHTFIKGIEKDFFMQYFYHIITELAHKTGMRLVVEGVETLEQLEIMLRNGVDFVQGYFFGRPMPAGDIAAGLENFSKLNPPQTSLGTASDYTEEMLGSRESYLITTNTFNVQTRCMQILMNAADMDAAINEVLELVGKHYNINRAYMYRRKGSSLMYEHAYEWCREGVRPHGLVREFDTSPLHKSWMRILNNKKMVVASDVNLLSKDLADLLSSQEIGSLAVVPVRENGVMVGFIGFDDVGYRSWQPEELAMLKNLGLVLSSCVTRDSLKRQVVNANGAEHILASLDMPIVVTELKSRRILWANDAMHRFTSEKSLTGKTCFSVLRRCDNRCQDCRATTLLNEPERKSVTRELYDEEHGRRLMVTNTLIDWQGTEQAQLEYILDVTEIAETGKLYGHGGGAEA